MAAAIAVPPGRISRGVRENLQKQGITVRTATAVKRADASGLYDAEGKLLPADVMVVGRRRARARVPARDRRAGNQPQRSLAVLPTLQATRNPAIFAFGDCAACPRGGGASGNVPALAQVAHQQAALLVGNLRRRLGGKPLQDYRYRDRGTLISLASYNAFGKLFGNRIIEGRLAHFFYASLYRMHQSALYGPWRTSRRLLGDAIARNTRPLLKLH